MTHKFKRGDVVRLRSGGPEMTVQQVVAVDGFSAYNCQWFSTYPNNPDVFTPELHDDEFYEECLAAYPKA